MTKIDEFIEKWNVGYEDREQKEEFARDMKEEILDIMEWTVNNLKQAPVISSIAILKNQIDETEEMLVKNATDGERYSDGLLKGYVMAARKIKDWMRQYCL